MTADEYFEKHPEVKKKFDDEIRNDNWGYWVHLFTNSMDHFCRWTIFSSSVSVLRFFAIKREDLIVFLLQIKKYICFCFVAALKNLNCKCSSGWDVIIQPLNREMTCFGHLTTWFGPHIDTFLVLLLTGNMQAPLFFFGLAILLEIDQK